MTDTRILAAFAEDTAYIRVVGRATFACSTCFRRFVEELLGEGVTRLVVDLNECPNMDSTFMGVLTKFALDLRRKHEQLEIARVTPENLRLLVELGVKRLFAFSDAELAGGEWLSIYEAGKHGDELLEQGKTSLLAHQKLIEADAANEERFGAVVENLAEDVKNLEAETENERKDNED